MIPAVSPAGAAAGQPVTQQSNARAVPQQAPEAARASAGEAPSSSPSSAAANAVRAPDQTAVAPRLRDQETAERTDRATQAKDAPTGPPPAFEESPLERQARVAFDPPDVEPAPAFNVKSDLATMDDQSSGNPNEAQESGVTSPQDPPPTPTERAEASFTETKALATGKEQATVDVEI